ncbi:DUF3180 family protein [Georgenia faecalis]|uniref:DUF3180 family protein n=1 Tax=Georgenia faecalis TaxID=2483799 RepID=A0ABV9DCT4_9MICO|nr:DUF3180 family protein [Georgenia faecalis]
MPRTRWQHLVVTAVVAGLLSYAVLSMLLMRGLSPIPVPGTMWAGLAVVAVAVLLLGRSVRRFTERKPTRMDALRAARVAVLAKASSAAGAALAGYFAAHVLAALANLGAPMLTTHAWWAGAAGLASLALVVVGLVVESWCRIPPDDDEAHA